jgi:hypothetical protein
MSIIDALKEVLNLYKNFNKKMKEEEIEENEQHNSNKYY